MSDATIQCPSCGASIELTQAVTHGVEERLRSAFDAEQNKLRAAHLKELAAKEAEAHERFAQLRAEAQRKAEQKVRDAVSIQLRELQEQNAEQAKALESSHAEELALRRRARQVEEREKALQVDLERRVDEARASALEQVQATVAEEQRLKDRERDKREDDLKKQLAVLKQKLEQGSQQAQGEAQEAELEDILRAQFPEDDIRAVTTGRRGADLIQDVRTRSGRVVGRILWESKRTKEWSPAWLDKVKEDQRADKADLAIIVTRVLPKGMTSFGCVDGVWVSSLELSNGAATALRSQLIAVGSLRAAQEGKSEKMELIYNYLTGPEFKARVLGIVEPFIKMQDDLAAERRAMERCWAKREKQLGCVMRATQGLYGDLEGLSGVALPPLETLELPEDVHSGSMAVEALEGDA